MLDIGGNKAEAERKAAVALKLNGASYITSSVYFIFLVTLLSLAIFFVRI